MEIIKPTLRILFAQLGEADDERAIALFVERNGPLAGGTRLHEATFWNPSQAAFLRDCTQQDASWAAVVDELNARLHQNDASVH